MDSENKNVDTTFPIEFAHDAIIAIIKLNQQNKTTTDCLTGNLDEVNFHEINFIECKTRCMSKTEERETNQWGNNECTKFNNDDPKLLDTIIEKSEATQQLHFTSVLGLIKKLLLIGNRLKIMFNEIWIIYPEDIKQLIGMH